MKIIEIVFAIVMYFIFIGFLVYIGWRNKVKDALQTQGKIDFNYLPFERTRSFFDFGLMESDIDCGYSKTIDDIPPEIKDKFIFIDEDKDGEIHVSIEE